MKKIVLLAFVLALFSTAVVVGFVGIVVAEGTIYIRANGSVEGTTHITSVDNVTYKFTDNINDHIVVERDNIVVDGDGYTLQGPGSGTGIDLSERSNVTVKNTRIEGFYYGIYLNVSFKNTISGNNITNNDFGIYLSSSGNNVLTGNNASNKSYGIWLEYSSNNTLTGNNASKNYYYGIYLSSSGNSVLTGNTASTNKYGIWLDYSSNNTLTGNNASNNNYGIRLYYSSNNTLTGNNASNNNQGIWLDSSSNNNVLTGNTASNNNQGIWLYYSSNNTLTGNNASNNSYGIWLDSSSNNTLTGNTASNNSYGIRLDYSSNNVLFHNNFIDNSLQASFTIGYVNTWDNGYHSGGNYWSNYTGVDLYSGPYQNETGSDGIGDSSHSIRNDKDNYPLMGMFSDFNATSEHHVTTICNSTISDFEFDQISNEISFKVTGKDGTTGFCRICIPTALMNGTYKVFVNGKEVPYNLLPFSNSTHSYLYFTYSHSTQEVMIKVPSPDTTPPVISVFSPENKTYPVKDVPLTFTASESTSWIGYSLDGQMNVTISGNTTIVGLSDGVHTIIMFANDTAGNMGYSDMVHFTVDTVSPNIGILSPENKTYTTSSVSLSFTVDEATSWIGYSLDGGANISITGNTTLSGLSDGLHSLIVYAKDTAGNTGASEIIYFSIKTKKAEPLQLWIVAAIVIIAIVGATLVVYFAKVKKKLEVK